MVVAIASVESREAAQQQGAAAPTPQQGEQRPQEPQQVAQPVRSSKWKIDESENLRSTAEHRLWTWGSMGLMAATLAQGLAQAHSPLDWAGVASALLASYVLSDLGTGIYHWGVDNWGGPETPVFGKQIAAFQGHHQRPWTITEREFCNNVHQVRGLNEGAPCIGGDDLALSHPSRIRHAIPGVQAGRLPSGLLPPAVAMERSQLERLHLHLYLPRLHEPAVPRL